MSLLKKKEKQEGEGEGGGRAARMINLRGNNGSGHGGH